jgi:hypothetical protein
MCRSGGAGASVLRKCAQISPRKTLLLSPATAGPFHYEAGNDALERAPASMRVIPPMLRASAILAGRLRDADEHHNNAIDHGEPVPPWAPHAGSCPPS